MEYDSIIRVSCKNGVVINLLVQNWRRRQRKWRAVGLTICFSTNRVPTVWPWIVPIETAKIGVAESGMDMRVPSG
jgi:hypothetical protein